MVEVPASEVDKVLDSMDILVVPETLQEVIKYANITSELFESMFTYFFWLPIFVIHPFTSFPTS